ncbi:MAG: hypothetical protein NTV16_05650 [Actinobacteria bacterium]|nr:hypothetical protein [Actinomycetota bacterium]
MVKTKVEPGICGFNADIEAEVRDYQFVTLKVNSACENIIKIAQKLKEFDAYNEIRDGFNGEFYKIIRENLKGCCSGCAIPIGLFKSMQVAAGIALPKDISIKIEK